MQKSPAIPPAAQKIRRDENGDLMIFIHFAVCAEPGKGARSRDGRLHSILLPLAPFRAPTPAIRLEERWRKAQAAPFSSPKNTRSRRAPC
jgi:hypothetical protein